MRSLGAVRGGRGVQMGAVEPKLVVVAADGVVRLTDQRVQVGAGQGVRHLAVSMGPGGNWSASSALRC